MNCVRGKMVVKFVIWKPYSNTLIYFYFICDLKIEQFKGFFTDMDMNFCLQFTKCLNYEGRLQ